ncbi:hypothetical protein M501DRAFT_989136 [Patellaria atrata CBS 101060]|uniref:Uncharacterized protein n=1 Tax=Patellaria atrata CBS 101060 TaxID=1346257 RepID=A0A9P4VL47_9PEZI|nr:hypothetical protein M501DRAFT_989136 [Patellaria atrata CBS 101060]
MSTFPPSQRASRTFPYPTSITLHTAAEAWKAHEFYTLVGLRAIHLVENLTLVLNTKLHDDHTDDAYAAFLFLFANIHCLDRLRIVVEGGLVFSGFTRVFIGPTFATPYICPKASHHMKQDAGPSTRARQSSSSGADGETSTEDADVSPSDRVIYKALLRTDEERCRHDCTRKFKGTSPALALALSKGTRNEEAWEKVQEHNIHLYLKATVVALFKLCGISEVEIEGPMKPRLADMLRISLTRLRGAVEVRDGKRRAWLIEDLDSEGEMVGWRVYEEELHWSNRVRVMRVGTGNMDSEERTESRMMGTMYTGRAARVVLAEKWEGGVKRRRAE